MAKPRFINANTLAAETADRWRSQYARGHGCGDDKDEIQRKLDALGPFPTPKQIEAVVGNDSWTQVPTCNGCGKKAREVVQVGEEPDYESSTANLCKRCLTAALAQFPKVRTNVR